MGGLVFYGDYVRRLDENKQKNGHSKPSTDMFLGHQIVPHIRRHILRHQLHDAGGEGGR